MSYPAPPAPLVPLGPAVTGRNRLAVAALVFGLLGVVPLVGVVAIVLGALALAQLGRRAQAGRGLAIAGIVLGALTVLGWVLIGVLLLFAAPERDASGHFTEATEVFVNDLRAGDCYHGGTSEKVDLVTVVPCQTPHESQVVTTFELPPGPYPGEDGVTSAADDGCLAKGDPLVRDDRLDDVELSFIYPADEDSWASSRTIACTADAPSGKITGSVLR